MRYHENLVDRSTKKIFIVMEHCENGDLAHLIKRLRKDKDFVQEDVVWKIFMQILLALRECHYRGLPGMKVLHRDLKPSNIFLDANDNVKLGDFGLSRIIKATNSSEKKSDEETKDTPEENQEEMATTNVGTPYYMSPEQINEVAYNEKTDIWSMGCVMYELVTLQPPFTATNHLALA